MLCFICAFLSFSRGSYSCNLPVLLVLPMVALFLWITADAAERSYRIPLPLLLAVLCFPPIAIPYYFVITRGPKDGLRASCLMLGFISFLPFAFLLGTIFGGWTDSLSLHPPREESGSQKLVSQFFPIIAFVALSLLYAWSVFLFLRKPLLIQQQEYERSRRKILIDVIVSLAFGILVLLVLDYSSPIQLTCYTLFWITLFLSICSRLKMDSLSRKAILIASLRAYAVGVLVFSLIVFGFRG